MKQMIYSAVRTQPEQLAVGEYKGFDYYVLSSCYADGVIECKKYSEAKKNMRKEGRSNENI